MRPTSLGTLPPALLGEARLIVAEGLLPPQTSIVRPSQLGAIVAVAGDFAYIFATAERLNDELAQRQANGALLAFEDAFKAQLSPFAGDRSAFVSAPGVLAKGFAWGARAPLPPRPSVFVHPAIDPSAPGVFVRLSIRNAGEEPARNVALRFASYRDFLRPSALYGDGAVLDGSVIRLEEPLRPGVKTLELRLEPQEPLSSPLTLELVQPGARGERKSTPARPLRVEVTLPRFSAPMYLRPKEVRAFLVRPGLARDVWRVRFTKAVTPAFAFERAQEAVGRERPTQLLRFASEDPEFFESWHLAQIKGTDRHVVVESAVRGGARLIEFRVATERPDELLGIKAEYRRRMRELLSERFMGRRARVQHSESISTDDARDIPQLHSSLLMRHLQGEIEAGDLKIELQRTASAGGGEGWEFVAGAFAEAAQEAGEEAPASPARPPRMATRSASGDFDSELLDGFTRLLAPDVLVQSVQMARAGPRLRRGLDRAAETEISDFETAQ